MDFVDIKPENRKVKASPPRADGDHRHFASINIRANHITELGKGVYSIRIEARPVPEDEMDLYRQRFPHLLGTVLNALRKEAFLQAIMDEE